jgi:flagella basal body P-ring formation protein FlgA
MILRAVIAVSALVAASLAIPSLARADTLRLRGDIIAKGDVLTLGDLVENAPAAMSARPLFRAPALGSSGTIQTRRIAEALDRLDLGNVETGGRSQIQVQRAARRVGPPEIEAALKRAIAINQGLDASNLSVRLDGEATLLAPLSLDGQANALDVTYDSRSHRIAGLIVLGDRQASLRVTGQVYETREVAVLIRSLNRGEAVAQADLTLERRPRDTVGGDALGNGGQAVGQVAQRSLSAGAVLRSGDVAPPELVQRGDAVVIVFEMPGVSLSLTGVANENGRLGAGVSVTNPASKKILQATVIGPGRVSVGPARSQPIVQASAAAPARIN